MLSGRLHRLNHQMIVTAARWAGERANVNGLELINLSSRPTNDYEQQIIRGT
jgi:hypothetical protein